MERIYASSEITFNLLIHIRKMPYAFAAVKEGKWRESEGLFRGCELNGLTLGIVGFGRIGGNMACYALAFGMKVRAYDPYVKVPTRGAPIRLIGIPAGGMRRSVRLRPPDQSDLPHD